MAADDEFESFRGSIADLDHDRALRIRAKFEGLRGPVDAENGPSAEDREVTRVELIADSGEPSARSRHRRPVLVGVAAAVVLMVLIGTITLVRSSDDGADVASSIDDVPLSELAIRARGLPAVVWPLDAFLHGERRTGLRTAKVRDRAETLTIENVEEWIRRDGTGKISSSTEVIALGPGTPFGSPSGEETVEVSDPRAIRNVAGYEDLLSLPTDPDELVRFAQAIGQTGPDAGDIASWLGRMLSIEVVPPVARAAGFRVLERLGAVSIGQMKNYSGEPNAAYSGVDDAGRPWVVLVDPVTTRVTGVAVLGGSDAATFSDAERWSEFGPQDFVDEIPD